VAAAQALVTEWPDAADALAARFWPGPLTLVLPKRAMVPGIVTAGFETVGLRVPRHPVALELLHEAGIPVAAPSANLFMRLSPTAREHVSLAGVMVLEGGDSEVGIESTVISLAGPARLLRPGAVSRAQIEKVIGPVLGGEAGESESPGLHARHYQPRTPLVWAGEALPPGRGAYVYIRQERPAARVVSMPQDTAGYASKLYKLLHELDAEYLDWIAVEQLPEGDEWAAVRDRLDRATFRT
jgi:L-threonylcarbamoyladenylate synthase